MTKQRYSADEPGKRPQFYGRRKGRALRAGQRKLLATLLPEISIPMEDAVIDPLTLFDPTIENVWMEVGFGGGEHLADLAEAYPNIGFIGCEPFINGVAKLLTTVKDRNLTNVRILDDDARLLMSKLEGGSISRIFVLFPDPWPKKRHWERRFIGPRNLDSISRILQSGGELRAATDHPDYLTWTLLHVPKHPDFEWLAEGPKDWKVRPSDWPATRYERKSLAGRPHFLRFVRR